jgi:hypothetical protein
MFDSPLTMLKQMEQIPRNSGRRINDFVPCLVGHLTLLDASVTVDDPA